MQRRTLLKLGIGAGATLTLAGGGFAVLYEPAWHAGRLTEAGRRVLGAIACAVLEGSLPAAGVDQEVALVSHLARMDMTLGAMPAETQRQVGALLTLLAAPPGRLALASLSVDWSRANVQQVQGSLQSMRGSRFALRRQAYHALRDLTHAAYFSDRATWVQLGYPGPAVIG